MVSLFEPGKYFRVDFRAILNSSPEQCQLIVTRPNFGADMRKQIAGVDTSVNEMQTASNFLGLTIV